MYCVLSQYLVKQINMVIPWYFFVREGCELSSGIYNKNWFVDILHYKDKYISCHIDISINQSIKR